MKHRIPRPCSWLTAIALFCSASFTIHAEGQTSVIEELIAKGKLQEAMLTTEEQLSRDPGDVNLLFLKGLIHTSRNELEQAKRLFIELTKQHPELPEPFNNLAVIYASQGDYDGARMALQQAINTHPSYATAHENLGDIYAKLASRAYNQALELDEENTNARQKLLLVSELFPRDKSEQSSKDTSGKLEESRAKLAELEKSLADIRRQGSREREETTKELEDTRQLLGQRQAELETLQGKLASMESQLNDTQSELSRLRADRELAASQSNLGPGDGQVSVAPTAVAAPAAADNRQADRQAILTAVDAWTKHWSAQEIDGYLAAYSSSFAPQGMTRERWMAQRRERLAAPARITVTLVDTNVTLLSPVEARVTFFQEYSSESYRDRVFKTLFMTKQSSQWLIEEERSN